MKNSLPSYPEYKETDLLWLGKIPSHWNLVPNRAFLKFDKKLVGEKSEDFLLLSLTKQGVIARDMENPEGKFPSSFESYQVIKPGDLIFCLFDIEETPRTVGLSYLHGMITGAYKKFVCEDKTTREYIYRFYLAMDNQKRLQSLYTGLRKTIKKSVFLSSKIPVPPSEEQRAIARYLDWADERIQRLIEAREKQIELLEEYKQAIIQQAVTGQFDVRTGEPYPDYKDSGVEWLRKVPKHWEIRRLKFLAKLNPSKNEFASFYDRKPDAKTVFLPMENISENGKIDASNIRTLSSVWNGYTYFRKNDILVAKITPCFENGKGAYLKDLPFDFGFGTTELFVLRASKEIHAEFLYWITKMPKFRKLGADVMTGAAGQQRVPLDFVKNFWLPLPPKREQRKIIKWIKRKIMEYDSTINTISREIELVNEYHISLIADVVTGKVDVRQAAANLPDREDQFDNQLLDRVENDLEGETYASQ